MREYSVGLGYAEEVQASFGCAGDGNGRGSDLQVVVVRQYPPVEVVQAGVDRNVRVPLTPQLDTEPGSEACRVGESIDRSFSGLVQLRDDNSGELIGSVDIYHPEAVKLAEAFGAEVVETVVECGFAVTCGGYVIKDVPVPSVGTPLHFVVGDIFLAGYVPCQADVLRAGYLAAEGGEDGGEDGTVSGSTDTSGRENRTCGIKDNVTRKFVVEARVTIED